MSVINKMLRDLDQRQAKAVATDAPVGPLPAGAAVAGDFARARPTTDLAPRRTKPALLIVACAILALVIGASWWVAQQAAPTPPALQAPAVMAVAPAAPASQVQAVASAPLAPAASMPALSQVSLSTPVDSAAEATATAVTSAPAVPVPAPVRPGASVNREPVTLGLRMDTTLSARKVAERTSALERPAAQTSELPKGPTPNEALERAQVLWNTGARDAAIELLQEAVVVAERAGTGGTYPQGNPVLMPLVREVTRMQLAESRHSAVWDLLTRLEPQLGTAPDLWAIRGNAAQRLGRHQDSVHAYMVALQSRPNEQRWLLGAAVSLAALGQTRSAADMADKARAVGVVSPEVVGYLRQMGVPFKDK